MTAALLLKTYCVKRQVVFVHPGLTEKRDRLD